MRVNPRVGGDSRRQLKRRFATVAEASVWYNETAPEFGDGTHIAPSDLTVKAAVNYADSEIAPLIAKWSVRTIMEYTSA